MMTAGSSMIDDANPASADKSIMTTKLVAPAGPVDLGVVELAVLKPERLLLLEILFTPGRHHNLLGDCEHPRTVPPLSVTFNHDQRTSLVRPSK